MKDKQEFLDFFFEASLNGWEGNAPEITLPELPGYKVIQWPRDGHPDMEGWFYRDAYFVDKETKVSAGFTNVWNNGRPMMLSGYGGHYPKEVIGFLKSVLIFTHTKKHFYGGRGMVYRDSVAGLEYKNQQYTIDQPGIIQFLRLPGVNSLHNYNGIETIKDLKKNQIVGYHNIWCMTIF